MPYIELSDFSDRYDTVDELGTGSNYVLVNLVRVISPDALIHPLRAVKKLRALPSKQARDWVKWQQECERLERLGINNFANIVRLHNYGIVSKPGNGKFRPFIEMDYINGQTIFDLVAKHMFIKFHDVLAMARDISCALALCHHDIIYLVADPNEDDLPAELDKLYDDETRERLLKKYRVIHNDIHPGNIMRHQRFPGDETGQYVLIDFGLSIENDDGKLSSTTKSNLPIEFRAPEKWKGAPITPATDIYCLGCVLYYYMAGTFPFEFTGDRDNTQDVYEYMNEHLSSPVPPLFPRRKDAYASTHPDSPDMSQPDYPEWFEQMILKCLEKKPSERFTDGRELYEFLLSHINEHIMAPAAAPKPETKPQNQRTPQTGQTPTPEPAASGLRITSFNLRFLDAAGNDLGDTPQADKLREVRMVLGYSNPGAATSRELSCRVVRADGTLPTPAMHCSKKGFTAHTAVQFASGSGQATLTASFSKPFVSGMHRYEINLGDRKLYSRNFDVKGATPAPPQPGTPAAFKISNVKLANAKINYDTISDYGEPMFERDMRFLCVRFNHEGLPRPMAKRLKFKIRRSDGTLLRASSADPFTHDVNVPMRPGTEQRVLIYGNSSFSVFPRGFYRLEIFDGDDKLLHAMMFTILEGSDPNHPKKS